MARVTFNGEAGSVYTNDTGKVQYQYLCQYTNSCATCIQFDHAVGPYWPIPQHRSCRCQQIPISPGADAKPFVDYIEKIKDLSPSQQSSVMGKATWQLVEKGVVKFEDVVTKTRVRTLQEVVSKGKLSVDQMTRAGVSPTVAAKAYATVNTPAHVIADQQRKALVASLAAKGLSKDQIGKAAADRLAARVGIGQGPSGPSKPPIIPPLLPPKPPSKPRIPKPKVPPKPILPQVAAKLGIKVEPPAPQGVPPVAFTVHGDLSDDAKVIVRKAMESIPPRVRTALSDHGVSIKIGRTMADSAPGMAASNDRPRGWPEGATWAAVGGYYDPDRKEVVANSHVVRDNVEGPNSRFPRTIRHEIGHAYDDALGRISNSEKFIQAYFKDVRSLTADQKKELGYYLQDGAAGPFEAFAEVFAESISDLPTYYGISAGVSASFPSVAQLMKGLIE